MALATYSDLQASIAAWLKRPDLTAQIPDFIALAESRMSSDFESRDMEIQVSLVTVGGNAYVDMPTDMIEMRRLKIIAVPSRVMKYKTPDAIDAEYSSLAIGEPVVFGVIGQRLQLAPIPDSTYTLELTYLQRIPALSATVTTNWVLTKYPQAYLYAALCEAAPYIVADERVALWEKKYEQAKASVNSVDWYSGSTMVMSNDYQ